MESARAWLVVALVLVLPSPAWAKPPSGPPSGPVERGVCFAHAWRDGLRAGYGTATAKASLERLAKLGVNAISVTPFGTMRRRDATEVLFDPARPGAESDAAIRETARQAAALGMRVMLKPHVWIGRGDWIGEQALPDDGAWRRWFASYRRFSVYYARLAAEIGAASYVIGVELKGASGHHRDEWERLIREVRAAYHGPLVYAANWDEEGVVFWDLVDAVGVQEYAPVADKPGATAAELRAGWARVAARLRAIYEKTKKPLLITEVGYRAVRDAALAPNVWPEHDGAAVADLAHQAAAYDAALEALFALPFVRGVYIWKWFSDSRDERGPTDFSPAGKPAETVLGRWYRR